jgi:hypothetical protein
MVKCSHTPRACLRGGSGAAFRREANGTIALRATVSCPESKASGSLPALYQAAPRRHPLSTAPAADVLQRAKQINPAAMKRQDRFDRCPICRLGVEVSGQLSNRPAAAQLVMGLEALR